jgi:hypothetical protein
MCKIAEADAADAEFTHIGMWTAAEFAAIVCLYFELLRSALFDFQ